MCAMACKFARILYTIRAFCTYFFCFRGPTVDLSRSNFVCLQRAAQYSAALPIMLWSCCFAWASH